MRPLRTAIIGCGGIAHRHAERLAGLAAIRENRPKAVPMQKGVRSLAFVLAAAESAEMDTPVDVV